MNRSCRRFRGTWSLLLLLATAVVAVPPARAADGVSVWSQASPATAVPSEALGDFTSLVFDKASGQLLRVGGTHGTWSWDGANWSQVAAAGTPPPRRAAIAAYDDATGQVVLFGGFPESVPVTVSQLFDTWTWNGAAWTQQHPTVIPDVVDGCAGYDAVSGRLLMVGVGTDGQLSGWLWTGTDWITASPSQIPPAPYGSCSMAADAASGQLVYLAVAADAGSRADAGSSEVWSWSGAGWVPSSGNPSGFVWRLAYDADTGEWVSLTDVPMSPPPNIWSTTETQLWSGSVNSWAQQSAAPAGLVSDSAMAYDAATHQLVYVGDTSPSSATWVYAAPGSVAPAPVRVFGPDRELTAVAISKSAYPATASASAVVLARDDEFADALAGGALAAAKDAPVLLTSPGTLDAATKSEIQRVLMPGGTVYLLGDTHALSDAVSSGVSSLGAVAVRLAGSDRFGTAVAIAAAVGNPSTVFEVDGTRFADALSAVPAAVFDHGVLLLTDGSKQATATAAYLNAHPGRHVAVGGAAVAADPSALAIAGADRYATSAAVALAVFPDAASGYLASGVNFPDALAGGPVAGAAGAPMLLVPASGALPEPVRAYLATHPARTPDHVLGSSSAVGDDVVAALSGAMR